MTDKNKLVFETTTLQGLRDSDYHSSLLGVFVFTANVGNFDPKTQKVLEPEGFKIQIFSLSEKKPYDTHKLKLSAHGITITTNFRHNDETSRYSAGCNSEIHMLLAALFMREAIKEMKRLREENDRFRMKGAGPPWQDETDEGIF
jgi:hypothetical protein